jgi:hypothetical protein
MVPAPPGQEEQQEERLEDPPKEGEVQQPEAEVELEEREVELEEREVELEEREAQAPQEGPLGWPPEEEVQQSLEEE